MSNPYSGTFFVVHHEFKADQAKGFFEWVGGLKDQDWIDIADKNLKNDVWNHSFSPCGPEGPCFCVWETKEPKTKEEFQLFIDGPDGPGAGKVFDNKVHIIMDGFPTPAAPKFPAAKAEDA